MTENHRDLIAAMNRETREGLMTRSDRIGLRHLAGHWGAIFALGTLILMKAPFWPLLLLPQGILIVFVFTTLHETIHKTAFRSERLNEVVADVCGLLLLLPPRWFRRFHFAHHRFTNDPERDPELATPKPRTLGSYLLYLSGIGAWRSHLGALIVNARGANADGFVPDRERPAVAAEARAFLAIYAALLAGSLAAGSGALLWVWLLPILLGQPFLRAYLLAEHADCPPVANMLENSRTTFTTAPVRFIAWNMPYHAEHHAFPAVPFHKLPEFHAITRAHLRQTESGYLGFHRRILSDLHG